MLSSQNVRTPEATAAVTERVTDVPSDPIQAGNLQIHIMGGGRGEAIIVRLPDGKWGVIDCCSAHANQPEKNATLAFLRQHDVTELAFLCITHPHADHYRGMSDLLRCLTVHSFWQFHGGVRLDKLIGYLRETTDGLASEQRDVSELETILDLVAEKHATANPTDFHLAYMQARLPLYPDAFALPSEPVVLIEALAPDGGVIHQYFTRLTAWLDAEDHNTPLRFDHNEISCVLRIRYGETCVLLGGDAVECVWRAVLATFRPEDLAAHLIKVSHHGSVTGKCDGLWEVVCANRQSYAVITPYASSGLPRPDMIEFFKQHTDKLLLTCQRRARIVLPKGIPPDSQIDLQQDSKLKALHPAYPPGVWSLTFDHHGNCTHTLCEGCATPL